MKILAATSKTRLAVACLALIALVAVAWSRVGLLDLPGVPRSLSVHDSGLAEIEAWRALDRRVRGEADTVAVGGEVAVSEAAQLVRFGLLAIDAGREVDGLATMRNGLLLEPENVVLGNAYRMALFELKRAHLDHSLSRGVLAPEFPAHLADEPIAFLTELSERNKSPETRLQVALAWVDHMLLFPALEIKAPSSVQAVEILTEILDDNPFYVPALFARGLNHLHRPARLVWPESKSTSVDAAARDIGLCVSIGRRVGVGSQRLQARLAIALGDAYVKAGRYGVARSWWQIAQNLADRGADGDLREAVLRRYGWRDEQMLDKLEAELDRVRSNLATPMTDLAFMWGRV